MSVPVNQRSRGKLEAYVKAYELAGYTLKITKNKKVFTEGGTHENQTRFKPGGRGAERQRVRKHAKFCSSGGSGIYGE